MFLPKLKSYYIILTVLILRSIATYPRITSECRRVTQTISAAGLFQWLFPAADRITRSLAAKSYVSWLTVNWRIESCRCCRVLGGEKNRKQRQWRKTQEPDTWASAHRSKWGQLTPPGKMDGKLRSGNMQKRAVFYVHVIFWEQSGAAGVENGAMLTTYLFRYTLECTIS